MKKILFTIMAFAALTACNQDDYEPMVDASDEIRITASVGAMTRVTTNGLQSSFTTDDEIMVYGWTGEAGFIPTEPPIKSVNTFDGSSWQSATQMLWQSQTEYHYFLGIYPVPAQTVSNFTAAPYTLDEYNQMESDLLVAVNTSGIKANNNGVNLEFTHVMAKLNINLTFRSQWENTPTPSEVKLYCGKEATVNYLTKTVTAIAYTFDAEKYIKMPGNKASYSSIVVPQTGVNIVDIVIDGVTYQYKGLKDIPLESGKVTTLNLNVGKDKVTLAGVSVGDWADGETIEGGEAEDLGYGIIEANGITTYTVYTAEGLLEVNALLATSTAYIDANITLAADIDLTNAPKDTNGSNWTPISPLSSNNYTGTFDGDGHTIRGLVINGTDYSQGLIGVLGSGTVKNVTLEGCSITGAADIGGIVGKNQYGSIENCIVKATSGNNVSITGSSLHIGGIVGISFGGSVSGCQVIADGGSVTVKSTGSSFVGGIVGNISAGSITACFVKEVDVTASSSYGSIVGNRPAGIITSCYAYGCTPTNIIGSNSDGTECYYTTDGGSNFGNVGGSDQTDWSGVMSAMNAALTTANITWQWDGTADNPTLTKK